MAGNTYKNEPKKTRRTKVNTPNVNLSFFRDPRLKLAFGLITLGLSVFLFFSFFSYLFTGKADQVVMEEIGNQSIVESGEESSNWLGALGVILSHKFIYDWFGISSFLFVPILFITGYQIVYKKTVAIFPRLLRASSFLLFWISFTLGYFAIISSGDKLQYICGGIGYEFAAILNGLFGWATALVIILSLLIFVIFFFDITSIVGLKKRIEEVFDEDETVSESTVSEDVESSNEVHEPEDTGVEDDFEFMLKSLDQVKEPEARPEQDEQEIISGSVDISKREAEEPAEEQRVEKEELEGAIEFDSSELPKKSAFKKKEVIEPEFSIEEATGQDEPKPEFGVDLDHDRKSEELVEEFGDYDPTLDLPSYRLPSCSLLEDRSGNKVQVSREELELNKNRIVDTLLNYKIGISSIKATIGPTVTLYEIVPEAGVKISKIKNLEDDIALSLAALGIRIIAPIPGRGTIGIEVPNKNREMVSVRSVFESEKFQNTDMQLPIVMGKTISNDIFLIDLAKMPHMLMAGATGQGKSVGINIILASLLYKKHPSQLKFVLVDPKKVELSIFSKIERHYLAKLPDSEEAIITDTSKVVNTLNSLCIEMDQRYDLLKDAGCRNIKEYNQKFVSRKLNPEKGHRFMPFIVTVIDELADLMMTAGKEVETPIARLAQLARAIGIHLVVATQRPSVNVITGIIKANFPARISFKVTSKIDSRTILDTGGADQLVGMGDMLFTQGSELTRVQCAFIDTPEVDAVVDFIGEQQGYSSAFLLPEYVDESSEGNKDVDLSDRDALFDEAARVIVMHQQGSTSLLQRKLKLGYNRAGRLIDQLEAAGVVGSFEGSKAREVLVPDEYSLEQLLSQING